MSKKRNLALYLFSLFFIIFFLSFILACSTTQPQISDRKARSIELNQKGEDAFKKAEFIKALNYYLEALGISRAIEDMDAMGKNMINIAYIYYKIGEFDRAHSYIDEILNNVPSTFNAHYLIMAMLIKSLIFLEGKNIKESSFWTEKAISLCEKNQCAEKGTIFNIKARILLLGKDNKSAMEYAQKALEFSKKINDKTEMANAFRIIGEIEFLNNNYNASIKAYETAFNFDRELELSEKMIKDLVGIAANYEKQNKTDDALHHYRRALSITQGTGNKSMEKSISGTIERIMQTKGNTIQRH